MLTRAKSKSEAAAIHTDGNDEALRTFSDVHFVSI